MDFVATSNTVNGGLTVDGQKTRAIQLGKIWSNRKGLHLNLRGLAPRQDWSNSR